MRLRPGYYLIRIVASESESVNVDCMQVGKCEGQSERERWREACKRGQLRYSGRAIEQPDPRME